MALMTASRNSSSLGISERNIVSICSFLSHKCILTFLHSLNRKINGTIILQKKFY